MSKESKPVSAGSVVSRLEPEVRHNDQGFIETDTAQFFVPARLVPKLRDQWDRDNDRFANDARVYQTERKHYVLEAGEDGKHVKADGVEPVQEKIESYAGETDMVSIVRNIAKHIGDGVPVQLPVSRKGLFVDLSGYNGDPREIIEARRKVKELSDNAKAMVGNPAARSDNRSAAVGDAGDSPAQGVAAKERQGEAGEEAGQAGLAGSVMSRLEADKESK